MTSQHQMSFAGQRRKNRLPIRVPGSTSLEPEDQFPDNDPDAALDSGNEGVDTARGDGSEQDNEPRQPQPSHDQRRDEIPHQPLKKVILFGALGAVLIAISLSPFGMGQLAFLAVAPWAWLTLDARRIGITGYLALLVAGMLGWIWLFLIEVDLGNGVLLMALPLIAYLALYVPLFILLGRAARSLFHLPSYLTLPVIWCGLEWLRCHLMGGFSLGLLAHAAADTRRILQLTDLIGSYGLGMLMVASGASVAELFWVTRRIRHLERRLPVAAVETEKQVEDSGTTSTSRYMRPGFLRRPARKKVDARASLEAAVRRNRDYARDVHLLSVTFSVMVIVGVLVFANSYGRSRVVETRTWKLFESNLFGITVLGGEGYETLFEKETKKNARTLLVACFDQPVSIAEAKRPTLTIARDADGSASWEAMLLRNGDEIESESLPLDPGYPIAKSLGLGALPSCRFNAQTTDVPLNMLATVSPTSNIEQTVNDRLRSEQQ